jgi:hypothetical protein
MKQYITKASENFAEREDQAGDLHPDLCFRVGQTHRAYGWSAVPRGDWDEHQKAAYLRGHRE